jgi:hypothetical protein
MPGACTGHFCAAEGDKSALIRKNSAENPVFGTHLGRKQGFFVFFEAIFCKKDQLQKQNPHNRLINSILGQHIFAQPFLVHRFSLNYLTINWLFRCTPHFIH